MSETADYDPGDWSGHDFASARKAYDAHVNRSYDDAVSGDKQNTDLLPRRIETDSTCPLVILCDVTGSMGEWPATIFSKLPYLEHEARTEYLGEDVEICFGAIGDAYSDKFPVQMRPFAKGVDLKTSLEGLVVEGGGGGQETESYELAAFYCARNIDMPKAIKPVLIMIGDEAPYDFVDKAQAEGITYGTLTGRLSVKDVFAELQRKFSVYLIRKPYGASATNARSAADTKIHAKWAEVIGDDRIAELPEAGRVVDVIFGILAREADKVAYFQGEIEDRQTPDQVGAVYKALTTIHKLKAAAPSLKKLPPGSSTLHKPSQGKKSRDLK